MKTRLSGQRWQGVGRVDDMGAGKEMLTTFKKFMING